MCCECDPVCEIVPTCATTVEPLYNSYLGGEVSGRCGEVAVIGRYGCNMTPLRGGTDRTLLF